MQGTVTISIDEFDQLRDDAKAYNKLQHQISNACRVESQPPNTANLYDQPRGILIKIHVPNIKDLGIPLDTDQVNHNLVAVVINGREYR